MDTASGLQPAVAAAAAAPHEYQQRHQQHGGHCQEQPQGHDPSLMEAPACRPKLGRQRLLLPQPQQLLHRSSRSSSSSYKNLSMHKTN